MKSFLLAPALLLCASMVLVPATASERTVKPVQFPKGQSTTALKGSIQGRNFIDYQLRAGAGQRMTVQMKASNAASYFNVLPPGSNDAAMAMGELGDNRFEGLLPDDGLYTVRVFLVRAAARRNATSKFTLSIAIEGKPLAALSSATDARVPGTRFHAVSATPCTPAYTQPTQCQVGVIRRSQDGSATVELQWKLPEGRVGIRRILFVQGVPQAADVPQPLTFTRDARGWRISFGADEHFDIAEPMVFGG